MATYYVDPAASGSNNGTSWTNAWTGMQLAIDGTNGTQPAAGDTIYMRGTETLTVSIDMDGNSGDMTSGWIKWVGVNASGVEDGTRYVIDGINLLSSSGSGLNYSSYGTDYQQFHNIEIKRCYFHGISMASNSGVNGLHAVNCSFNNNGRAGWSGAGLSFGFNTPNYASFYHCQFTDNAQYGVQGQGHFFFCEFARNGSSGYWQSQANAENILMGCLIHSNGAAGIDSGGSDYFKWETELVIGNVIDGNADGIFNGASTHAAILGNRFTNNSGYAIEGHATSNLYNQYVLAYNYIPDTGQDGANTTGKYNNNPIIVSLNGSDTNELSGTDTDAGYTDSANDNFNLTSSATLRAVEIDIDGTNKVYVSAGLEPSGGGGGTDAVLVPQGLHPIDAGITA